MAIRMYDLFIFLTTTNLCLAILRGCGIFMIQEIRFADSCPLFSYCVRYRSHAKDHKRLLIVYELMCALFVQDIQDNTENNSIV